MPIGSSGGQAVFSISTLTAGTHSITALYYGDSSFNLSTSAPLAQVVCCASTTTTISSGPNPSVFGQSVTFTTNVRPLGPGVPTGTVTWKDGATTLATGTLSGGQAMFSISTLMVGTHSITALYSGDSSFNSSASAPLAQVVNRVPTTTAISSSANPSIFGQSVTFTATVAWQFGGTPTGSVTFSIDGVAQPPSPLNGGVATISSATLTPGLHFIDGVYSGDSNFAGSTSADFMQVVTRAFTRTTITSSINPALVGQSVTFTATVTGHPGTPTGSVILFIDGVASPTLSLSGGVATFSTMTLTQGLHIIVGVYSGDGNFAPSTSANFVQLVNSATQAVTTTAMTANTDRKTPGQPANTVYLLQKLTLTAQVTSGSGTPTGTVGFRDNGVLIGTAVPVDMNGRASLSVVQLTLGSHSIIAIYGGDTTFGGSLSPPLVIQRSPKPR